MESGETVNWGTGFMEWWIFGSYLPWEGHFGHYTHTVVKVKHLKESWHFYFRNQLRIFINRKEKFSGSFPPTAVPTQQILAFSEQKSAPNWKMASELILPESQVSCTFLIFQGAWIWLICAFLCYPRPTVPSRRSEPSLPQMFSRQQHLAQ